MESCDPIGWPQPFLRAPYTSPLKLASAADGLFPSQHTRTEYNLSETQTDPLSRIQMLILHIKFVCGRDFVHAAIILKGASVSLPQAPLHTNVISAVTQAAFTGRKPEWGWKAAIVHPVFTDVGHNYIFITKLFCRIANLSVTFHSATVGNLFRWKEPGFLSTWKYSFKHLLGSDIWATAILQKSNSGFSRWLAFIYFSITWRIDQAPLLSTRSTGLSQRLSVCQSVARRFAYRRASSSGSQTITADK